MPISANDLAALAKSTLDDYLRNIPVDQIATERPLLKKLLSKRKNFLGAKQNVVENIRTGHGSNFAWTYGEAPVAFNKRQTLENASFPWRRAVDALYIDHDTLFSNGVAVKEGDRGAYKLETNEKVQLVNLLDENMAALKEGFMAKLDLSLHRDGTSSTDAIAGLDSLVSVTPAVGTVGGINAATASYWRNNAATGIVTTTKGTLTAAMEKQWRACIKTGGIPDFILAGGDFIDAYSAELTVTNNAPAGSYKTKDAGTGSGISTGLFFKGVEILWDPQFDELQTLETADVNWNKRCYFLNTKHMAYRDDGMDIVMPTRPHNVLALYAMVNLRAVLTTNKRNAHSVLSIA